MRSITLSLVHETILKYRDKSQYDLNCSETMIAAFSELYDLNMDPRHFSAFGGGMGIGDACGSVTGAVGILGALFVQKNAYENQGAIKKITQNFFHKLSQRTEGRTCGELKPKFFTQEKGCNDLMLLVGEVLFETIEAEGSEKH
jgi:C_GCAxxG_C_C family probable redox protein